MNDKLPLFILQGFLFFIQNVTEITKTNQLTDTFILLAALKYNNLSTPQQHVYDSKGWIASVADYNNDKIVDACLGNGCSYQVILHLRIKTSDSSMSLDFTASPIIMQTREPIYVQMIRMYFEQQVLNFKLPTKIKIYDKVNISIPITQDQLRDINFWEDIQVNRKK